MKPSNSANVVAILNTPAELSVVFDAIKQEPLLLDPQMAQPDIASRFRDQTRFQPQVTMYTFPGPLIPCEQWKIKAEFPITYDDEDIVVAAARRVLNEQRLFIKARNIATRRLQAAQTIVTFFDTPRKWRTW